MSTKFKSIVVVGALLGTLALVGCGPKEQDPNHIKVGVIVGSEQQVAEVAQKVAKEKYGLNVELVTFNDYVLPNEALSKGEAPSPSSAMRLIETPGSPAVGPPVVACRRTRPVSAG